MISSQFDEINYYYSLYLINNFDYIGRFFLFLHL